MRILMLLLVVPLAVACGGNDIECDPPEVIGPPFGGSGTARLTGTGTFPGGMPERTQFNLTIEADGGGAFHSILGQGLLDIHRTCGTSVIYDISEIDAGTWYLGFEAPDYDNEDVNAPNLFEGRAATTFTVADGETVAMDFTFE